MFLETSALTGEGVGEVFLKCARNILTKIETGVINPESMNSGVQPGSRKILNKSPTATEGKKKKETIVLARYSKQQHQLFFFEALPVQQAMK